MMEDIPYYGLHLAMGSEFEWIFEDSPEVWSATEEFDAILEYSGGAKDFGTVLRRFLKKYPWHIDALTHYATCKRYAGRALDGFAFASSAVLHGRNAFPKEFDRVKHEIPGGFVQNRPFLRALHELMESSAEVGDLRSAVEIGYEMLGFDREDKMGARLELPWFLVRLGRFAAAAEIFEHKRYKETFFEARYLYPVVLLELDRIENAIAVIQECLVFPDVARYILDPSLDYPEWDSPVAAFALSPEQEGSRLAQKYREHWLKCDGAIELLQAEVDKLNRPRR